ncbi:hypothetical protein AB0I28_23460 [Phytomonospora sp. NPDC050363]|uniref:hypothetical protein n=1 Tax=Phytomonospora sp. NPDC050363 TaxID=3155642 RepID=UPI0033FD69C4
MRTDFHERVNAMITGLDDWDDTVVEARSEKSWAGDPPVLVESKRSFADGVEPYWLGAREVQARWRSADQRLGGEFRIPDVRACLDGGPFLHDDPMLPDGQAETMASMRIIEATESGRLTGLRHETENRPELWFYDTNHHRLDSLELDYSTYMEMLLLTRGVSGWQYLFADIDLSAPEFNGVVGWLDRALVLLPPRFPDERWPELERRLDARAGTSHGRGHGRAR